MSPDFPLINLINSATLDDIRGYSATCANLSNLPIGEITSIDYITIDDMKYADQWTGPHFAYNIHDTGYRNTSMPQSVDIAVFGCSFTFGVGLPNEMIWSSLLADKLNMSVLNFGLPGSSAKTAMDLFLIVSKHIKIKYAVFLLPSHTRIQMAKTHPKINITNCISLNSKFGSRLADAYELNCEELYKHYPNEEMLKVLRNDLYLVDYVSALRGIKTFYSSWDAETYSFMKSMNLTNPIIPPWMSKPAELAKTDFARDKMHPGPKHHQYWANTILEYIK